MTALVATGCASGSACADCVDACIEARTIAAVDAGFGALYPASFELVDRQSGRKDFRLPPGVVRFETCAPEDVTVDLRVADADGVVLATASGGPEVAVEVAVGSSHLFVEVVLHDPTPAEPVPVQVLKSSRARDEGEA